ncbi:MAG: phosphotransferase family protein [Actinomycetota bacterium]
MAENESAEHADAIVGYDVDAVEAWVTERVPALARPWTWTRLEGGHSNLTYRIDGADGAMSAVIRRPPMGELLPKAHDMGREWSCISALWDTPVPVAQPLAFCEGPEVTGAHFYVMGLVDGKALYTGDDVNDWVPLENRRIMAESWIDTLAALHSLDPDEIGLSELGKKEDYVVRQTRTWYRSWMASIEAAEIDSPEVHELHDLLMNTVPEQGPATLVHGDYGTHNVMIGRDARIAAVVDWEIATLGDPMADFAYSLNAWIQPDDELLDNSDAPTLQPGFPTRDEILSRYAAQTGRDMSSLPYYLAFNRFKTACILHGVYARYKNGQKAIDPTELDELRGRVMNTIVRATTALEELKG